MDNYIISIRENDIVTLAQYDKKTKRFYSFQRKNIKVLVNNSEIKVGQEIHKLENGDTTVNEEVVRAVAEYKLYRKELAEKYKFFNPLKMHTETLFSLLNEHFNAKYTTDTFDYLRADCIYLICKAMGLDTILSLPTEERIRYGIRFPEDILEIVDAISNILTEREIKFYFYNFHDKKRIESMEYAQLKCDIERRSHVNMNKISTEGTVIQRIFELKGATNTLEYKRLSNLAPYIESDGHNAYYNENTIDLIARKITICGTFRTENNKKWTLYKQYLRKLKDY